MERGLNGWYGFFTDKKGDLFLIRVIRTIRVPIKHRYFRNLLKLSLVTN